MGGRDLRLRSVNSRCQGLNLEYSVCKVCALPLSNSANAKMERLVTQEAFHGKTLNVSHDFPNPEVEGHKNMETCTILDWDSVQTQEVQY